MAASKSLPRNAREWRQAVAATGRADCTLADMPPNPKASGISGSKMPYDFFLPLRALWPDAMTAKAAAPELQEQGFFSLDNRDLAKRLILSRSLTSPKSHLLHFLTEIADGWGPHPDSSPATPASRSSDFHLHPLLGGFSPVLSLWRVLKPRLDGLQPTADRDATPKVLFWNSLDFTSMASLNFQCSSAAPVPDMSSYFDDDDDDAAQAGDVLDTPSKPMTSLPTWRKPITDFSAMSRSLAALAAEYKSPSSPGANEATAAGTTGAAGNIKPGARPPHLLSRTNYEIQTACFFAPFLHALHTDILSMLWDSHLLITCEERRYNFGPGPPGVSASGPMRRRFGFTACPDGAFYIRNVEERGRVPYMLFELKPYRRRAAHDVSIALEESAEMAAFLTHGPRNRKLMLALDQDEFWIIMASFGDAYLEYITSTDKHVVPANNATDADFISFQRFGPFTLSSYDSMVDLCIILISLALSQLQATPQGSALYQRLCGQ
ncbi:uncharacterized protein LY79DRAFT_707066 [Colletotrichum navitas]|uniref:Uncharacterized protein n=1 Tax=Colletotrichum navitas TaxID=681940 RepID=A0AAD8PNK4_9PEZI|nr:uncharacterized protein LY79DRAFT_707066 [Colletotrichum navitas]KAK1573489.1 hypothetical protein LY79DRAFT_707066 [Colletotrichum navitas]